ELEEQILPDGAHFELSPMYHQIILYHLLDSINLLQKNMYFNNQEYLLIYMEQKARLMLKWINMMTFSNGEIPMLNDAAPGIAPSSKQLNKYAINLKIITEESFNEYCRFPGKLTQSGYRFFKNAIYECFFDIGFVGPSYQPGHAHADTFNFVLNIYNKPIIIDTGVSTYDPGEVRLQERGTRAHNTVTVLDADSSEIWSSFSIARRANVKIIEDNGESVVAQHDGYKKFGVIHRRRWIFANKKIVIIDKLIGKVDTGKAYLHIAPEYIPEKEGNSIKLGDSIILLEHSESIEVIKTKIPRGYNQFQDNYTIEILFRKFLNMSIITK
ncbi:MAG: heparinase II/III family protein, partial [Bacteroidales bacterium]|nr:heparinase II/III family protein [Bacteroidales bacterium]